MNNREIAQKIFEKLLEKGAGIGNASIPIIEKVLDESSQFEPLVSPESGGQLADKILKANTRLILGDSTSEDEKFLLVNRKFLREYITDLQNMLDDIG